MDTKPLQNVWQIADPTATKLDLTGIVRRVHTTSGERKKAVSARKTSPARQDPGSDFVEALAHGLALFESWQDHDTWLTNAQISERSGLTRTTVSRLSAVLVDLGYLARESQRGRLRLTALTLSLGFGNAFARIPASASQQQLKQLASELDVYAALSIRQSDLVQVVENVVSPYHPDAVVLDVGGKLPICRSASGFAALCALKESEASPLLERLRSQYGERWSPLARQIERSRQEYLSKGYCTSVSNLSRNIGAVAVPVIPTGSDDIFVLGCGMSAQEFYPERVEREIAPQLLKVAEDLKVSLSA
ncbi:helix-turn-helix domain-containing protein [Cupriavidus sp. DF5525]|uniref:IclR family transcriptional regulator n=1 Tax=Cupriavidus sp. DF5525 TaxID=3160989 RepID=UPI0032DF5DDD